MKFRPGDKVKFLNEDLQGEVISIRDDQKVYVRIQDGFEIPATEGQLVLMDNVQEDRSKSPQLKEERLKEDLYILLYPQANQSLKVYFANYSGAKMAACISASDKGNYDLLYLGSVDNESQVSLDTLSILQSQNWPVYHIQALFEPTDEVSPPYYRSLSLDGTVLDRNTRKINGKDAYVFGLKEANHFQKSLKNDPIEKEDIQALMNKDFTETPEENKKERIMPNLLSAFEVDLHIEKIDENWRKLAVSNILPLQLMHASKAIDEAYSAGQNKVVLIHGSGTGTLKNELLKMLAKHDAVKSSKPADPLHYGGGALEVTLN